METSKIDFAFFWTFLEFLWILQVTGQNFKKVKNLFALRSLELFWFHTNALGFYSKSLQECDQISGVPGGAGEFAADNVGLGQ
jgi:hypothetical protein